MMSRIVAFKETWLGSVDFCNHKYPAKTRPVRKPRKPPVTTTQPKGMTCRCSNGIYCSLWISVALPVIFSNDVYKTPPRTSLGGASSTKLIPFDQLVYYVTFFLLRALNEWYFCRDDCATAGLLGHVLAKVHLLIVTRRFMERNADTCTNGMMVILLLRIKLLMLLCDIDYVKISIDLAHEYVKLGRMERATLVYGQTVSSTSNSHILEGTRVFLFLRFAESSAIIRNVLQKYDF